MTYEEWRCVKCHRVRKSGDPPLEATLTAKYRSGKCVGCKRALRMFERVPALVYTADGLVDEHGETVADDSGAVHKGQGDALRDAGMQAAHDNAADGVDAAWQVEARLIVDNLIMQRREFSVEDITDRAGLPISRNAVGAFMGALARSGRVALVGYRKGQRNAQHSRRVAIWRAV